MGLLIQATYEYIIHETGNKPQSGHGMQKDGWMDGWSETNIPHNNFLVYNQIVIYVYNQEWKDQCDYSCFERYCSYKTKQKYYVLERLMNIL